MAKELKGKRALVTGAASGMGKAIAQAFAREGAGVAVHARSEQRAKGTVDAITKSGGKAFAVAADLTKPGEIKRMCQEALKKLGGIDIVVNNAGVYDYLPVTEMTEKEWDWIVDTDLKAPFLVTKYTLAPMIKQKSGCLIFNASTNGKTADGLFSAYNAAKHGLIGFARCVAHEVSGLNINVNTVCPGWIDTKMAVDFHSKWSKEHKLDYKQFWKESMAGTNMLKTMGTVEDIAEFAVYLASPKGRFIHAQAINICGGLCYW